MVINEKKRWANIKQRYLLSKQEWDTLYNTTNGTCWICGGPGPLVVDHIEYGVLLIIRGLLCNKCNSFLGWLDSYDGRIQWYLGKPPAATKPKPSSYHYN